MGIFDKILGKGKPEKNIRTYQDFWDWFLTKEKTFFEVVKDRENIEEQFFDVISPELAKINSGYYFLSGMSDEHTAELIITVEGDVRKIIFAEELIAVAPQLDRWKFTALKPQTDIENVGIRMNDLEFRKDNIWFYSNEIEGYPDEIDLVFVYEDLNEENRSSATTGICIFLDNFLGELNFATQIDTFSIIGKNEAEKELVPIEKLKDFLLWREREFTEKYKDSEILVADDQFSLLEGTLENGMPLMAVVNAALLKYKAKASYPWISVLKITYDGSNNDGLPEEKDYNRINNIEDLAIEKLPLKDGHLYIGRETADSCRSIFFASKDFRQASKIFDQVIKDNPEYKITLEIYKDKYWQSFESYNVN
ncbi:DUF695 domain-containing protein [Chryseobacterium shigense]|uniref:DUF695 domain-containing protein n=1 Tax=Chryseobacterium shigense TaxID=297244 RepID=A0A841N648_9FLAO|nr:DUF695 domain-containing protein [Chryseobacterium shigense]MBB6372566.1 hypothetical protein [Chryseobacterium shigense]